MPSRRFREQQNQFDRQSTDAELAHQNLLAINSDLRRQVTMLESSASFRIGRLALRILQPLLKLLRIKKYSNRPPEFSIESTWPRLSGRVTSFQATADLVPVKVNSASETILDTALDLLRSDHTATSGPATSSFEFHYPLGFHAFDSTELIIRIGNKEIKGDSITRSDRSGQRILRPIDIALDSIVEVRGEPDALRNRLRDVGDIAVLSTFRDAQRVHAVPHRLIEALRAQGFLIVVVDTSDSLPDSRIDSDLLIHRRNIGWDFASWMSTLARFPWLVSESKQLLLINDSNIGPFRPLADILERGRKLEVDIWGLTDSWDIRYHLQSYFLHFNTSALRSGHLSQFIESFAFPGAKDRIIGSGEIGLSQFMIDKGLGLGAVFPYSDLTQKYLESFHERIQRVLELPEGKFQTQHSLLHENDELNFILDTVDRIRMSGPMNPTHHFWDILLSDGFPFIKRDLLMKNPEQIPDLYRLSSYLESEECRQVILDEVNMWRRNHPDLSLPLVFGSDHPPRHDH